MSRWIEREIPKRENQLDLIGALMGEYTAQELADLLARWYNEDCRKRDAEDIGIRICYVVENGTIREKIEDRRVAG